MTSDCTVYGHAVFAAIGHLPLIAGIGYSLAWAIGLSVFSSSTEVRITGTQVVGLFAGHEGAVATQYVKTEGVPALCLLAVLAAVTVIGIRRGDLPLPRWLGYLAVALALTITISAIGYLTLDNTTATAAWLSLPCLMAFVTTTGILLSRRPRQRDSPTHSYLGPRPRKDDTYEYD